MIQRPRLKSRLLPAILLLLAAAAPPLQAQKAVILVRHAERLDESDDSALSPAGLERARRLAQSLKDANVDVIFTSDRRRTIQTAEPLAELLGIKPIVAEASNYNGLVNRIRSSHAGDVVLIVGHSNTIPGFLRAFGATEEVRIELTEHDNVFVLVPRAGDAPVVVRLRMQ